MKYKYCVWDMGKVIYDFSFEPLDSWCRQQTSDMEGYLQNRKKLDYDDYMRGEISFFKWCQRLCALYHIPWQASHSAEINKAFHRGVSRDFAITRRLMQQNADRGIENCILSNALPNLADTGNCWDLVKKENCFPSFELGLLKPDPQIYEAVRSKLSCTFAEMIFIDDKPENVKAASELGISAVVFSKETISAKLSALLSPQNPKLYREL